MRRQVGLSYHSLLFHVRNRWSEFSYQQTNDFRRLWRIMRRRLKRRPQYMVELRRQYDAIFERHRPLLDVVDRRELRRLSDQELLRTFQRFEEVLDDSVGLAHAVCEPIGIEGNAELTAAMVPVIPNPRQRHAVLSILTTPRERSFHQQEEDALRRIRRFRGVARDRALKRHATRFHWIQNSYAGGHRLGPADFRRRLKSLPVRAPRRERVRIPRIPINLRRLATAIAFAGGWQDARKANTLQSIAAMTSIVNEAARRLHLDPALLLQFVDREVAGLRRLEDVRRFLPELRRRQAGCFVLCYPNRRIVVSGRSYRSLLPIYQRSTHAPREETHDLQGTTASQGTARGRARVCTGLSDIARVQPGEILVTSMTRPEFLPAMRRAAGVVTDEGGITSHAAIVSRELGIPCVIGTRFATKILRDGDLVDVRANHGIVRILERAS